MLAIRLSLTVSKPRPPPLIQTVRHFKKGDDQKKKSKNFTQGHIIIL